MDGTSPSDTPRILLHVCCGPCGTACVERLRSEGRVTLFFSNANIFPPEEYARRLKEARKLAARFDCAFVEDEPRHDDWLAAIRGLEGEPERGARCLRCFEYSLRRAAAYARAHGFDRLTTSLTVSPHKRSPDIFRVGRSVWEAGFLEVDFKKRDGFRRSLRLAEELGMVRQDYCGCEFSLADARKRRRANP